MKLDLKCYWVTYVAILVAILIMPCIMFLPKEFGYENGLLENLQLIALFIGGYWAYRSKTDKKFFYFVIMVIGILVLREINTGRVLSKEACEKMSRKLKGCTPWNKGKKMTEEQKKNMRHPNKSGRKAVICCETNVRYESLAEAERVTGINAESISLVCRGKREKAGEYHWAWAFSVENFVAGRKIKCVETGVEYNSIKEASELTGIGRSSISEALRKGGASREVHWEYID